MFYYQTIREKTSTSKISLSELFLINDGDNLNEEIMKRCCELCFIWDWAKEKDVNVTIKNEISGGQKSRLLIAVKLYQMIVMKKRILILDEPEQGSDPDVAYGMLKNIVKGFPDITIFIICHLENIHIEQRCGFKFDKVFKVGDGLIKQID